MIDDLQNYDEMMIDVYTNREDNQYITEEMIIDEAIEYYRELFDEDR